MSEKVRWDPLHFFPFPFRLFLGMNKFVPFFFSLCLTLFPCCISDPKKCSNVFVAYPDTRQNSRDDTYRVVWVMYTGFQGIQCQCALMLIWSEGSRVIKIANTFVPDIVVEAYLVHCTRNLNINI